jgi:hypothetical protein
MRLVVVLRPQPYRRQPHVCRRRRSALCATTLPAVEVEVCMCGALLVGPMEQLETTAMRCPPASSFVDRRFVVSPRRC